MKIGKDCITWFMVADNSEKKLLFFLSFFYFILLYIYKGTYWTFWKVRKEEETSSIF